MKYCFGGFIETSTQSIPTGKWIISVLGYQKNVSNLPDVNITTAKVENSKQSSFHIGIIITTISIATQIDKYIDLNLSMSSKSLSHGYSKLIFFFI